MTATYTFDVLPASTATAPPAATGPATGASKAPSCSTTACALYGAEQRMVFGADTYRAFARMLASSTEDSTGTDSTRIAVSHRGGSRSLTVVMESHRPKEHPMPIVEIYRVRIDPANVDRLLEIHEAAVAEFKEQVPELLGIDLVRLDDDVWLDIIRWSAPVDDERLAAASGRTPTAAELHTLMSEELGHDRGELVHSSGYAWASAR
jgi:hypothetical protein